MAKRTAAAASTAKPKAAAKPEASADAPAKEPAEAPAKAPKGTTRIYPTHKRQRGPLSVALPAVDGESGELSIDDDGADVADGIAAFLVAGGEATTEKPKE